MLLIFRWPAWSAGWPRRRLRRICILFNWTPAIKPAMHREKLRWGPNPTHQSDSSLCDVDWRQIQLAATSRAGGICHQLHGSDSVRFGFCRHTFMFNVVFASRHGDVIWKAVTRHLNYTTGPLSANLRHTFSVSASSGSGSSQNAVVPFSTSGAWLAIEAVQKVHDVVEGGNVTMVCRVSVPGNIPLPSLRAFWLKRPPGDVRASTDAQRLHATRKCMQICAAVVFLSPTSSDRRAPGTGAFRTGRRSSVGRLRGQALRGRAHHPTRDQPRLWALCVPRRVRRPDGDASRGRGAADPGRAGSGPAAPAAAQLQLDAVLPRAGAERQVPVAVQQQVRQGPSAGSQFSVSRRAAQDWWAFTRLQPKRRSMSESGLTFSFIVVRLIENAFI